MLNKKRMEAAAAKLREKGFDALVLSVSSMDSIYLSGLFIKPDERFKALVIVPNAKDGHFGFALAPTIYKHEFEEEISPSDLPYYLWNDEDWFYGAVKKGLDEFGVPQNGKIAFSDSVLAVEAIEFAKRWGYKLEVGAEVMSSLRLIKDAEEVSLLKKVGAITDAALNDLAKFVKPGVTEKQILDYLFERFIAHGADPASASKPWGMWGIIAKSENASVPHYTRMDSIVNKGDSLLMDVGCTYKGYHSDVTRTIFVGEPTEERRKIYETVRAAQQAGIDAVRPGAIAADIDKATRDVIEKAGYGKYFYHRTGHGIGLAVHEDPYISSAHTSSVLKEGMAFSVEPGIYIAGEFGVRIEDIVVVTKNGCETMTKFPKTLTVI